MPQAASDPSGVSATSESRSRSRIGLAQSSRIAVASLVDESDVGEITCLEQLDQGVEVSALRRASPVRLGERHSPTAFFRAGAFLAVAFLAELFLADDFLAELFLAEDFFVAGFAAGSSSD